MLLKTIDPDNCESGVAADLPARHAESSVGPHDTQRAAQRLAEAEQAVAAKTFSATVMSTAMQYAFRRENLAHGVCRVGETTLSALNLGKIDWIQLAEVGLSQGLTAIDYAQMTEKLLQFFHRPGSLRFVYFVSSDGEKVRVRLGLREGRRGGRAEECRSAVSAADNFSRAYWPGLRFEAGKADSSAEEEVGELIEFSTDSKGHKVYSTGLYALTGLPSCLTNRDSALGVFSTVDKLASGLSGKKWGYLVVAEPLETSEIDKAVFLCRELAGRAESMKQFQCSQSLTETISRALSQTWSSSVSTKDKPKESADSGSRWIKGGAAVGLATAGVAALAVACPALIPAILAGGELVVGGLLGNLGSCLMIARALKKRDDDRSTLGTSYSQAVSDSASSAQSVGMSETIVNKHAEAMARLLDEQIRRYECAASVGAWETGVYLVAEDDETARIGAEIVKSMVSGGETYAEPVRIHDLKADRTAFADDADPFLAIRRFDNPSVTVVQNGQPFAHPLGERYNRLSTVVHSRELVRFVNFPLSSVSEIPLKRVVAETGIPQTTKWGLDLGRTIIHGRESAFPYRIPPACLAKHTLVCGINGSGKSNTVLGILGSLLAEKTPFLVVEPAKQEYVEWAVANNDRILKACKGRLEQARRSPQWINVFMPGRKSWRGHALEEFDLNPFDFVWLDEASSPTVAEHIDRLKTLINASLPMQEILPVLMEELLYRAYGTRTKPRGADGKYPCWLPSGPEDRQPVFGEDLRLPNFIQLLRLVPSLLKERTYAQDIARNIQAALESRLASFTRGWRGDLLNREKHSPGRVRWESFFARPTVINLTSLTSDDDKAFLMGMILMFLYEYRQALAELGSPAPSEDLRHLLVIEEAHRILTRADATGAGVANPRRETSSMFSNMISEVRAYRQGVLIADQIPCRLNDDAVKNTNLKIVHRLVSADDRIAMSKALNLWDDQERMIGDLSVGEAVVRGDDDREAYLIKVNRNKA